MKKIISILLVVVLSLSVLAGCKSEEAKTEGSTAGQAERVLRIAAQPYPLYTPVICSL